MLASTDAGPHRLLQELYGTTSIT